MKNVKIKSPLMGLILVLLFLLGGCFKDPIGELPVNSKTLLLTEFKSDNEITRFEYNADSSISKLFFTVDPISNDQNVTYTVKYLTNKKVDELVGSNGTRIKISNGVNGISKSEVFLGTTKNSTTEYSYDGARVSSVLIIYSNIPSIGTPRLKYEFSNTIPNNVNRVKLLVYKPATGQYQDESVVNFQFDNKINPFTAAGDLMLIFWEYANKNNIIRQENRDMGDNMLELIETNFTYNSFNYPTNGTQKITEPGMQPTIRQLSFTYK